MGLMRITNTPAATLTHPALGEVLVRNLAGAVRYTARVKGGRVHITGPAGVSASEIMAALDRMAPRLLDAGAGCRPPAFSVGWRMECDCWSVEVVRGGPARARQVKVARGTTNRSDGHYSYIIYVGPDVDLGDEDDCARVRRAVYAAAAHYTRCELLPMAAQIADSLGVHPREWHVSHGDRRLGTCSARGVISISDRVALRPMELRRYVITHELAHLTHFDHSAGFKRLWERYFGTPLAPARARMRAFRLPPEL